jgi:hypothetical protein
MIRPDGLVLIMRRAFVAHNDTTAARGLAFPFALHQHMHAAVQGRDLGFLTGDNIAQVFDGADQMGDLFF